jgi:hypothetical protein
MDHTVLGRAGELAFALYGLVTSAGELELFTPVADDDHVDATGARKGGMPAIAIQVKTGGAVDKSGQVEARASFPAGQVREHPAFLYAVLLLDAESVAIAASWLVPSPDFNRLAYRHIEGSRETLSLRAYPTRDDACSEFRVPPLEIGPRLLAFIDSLEEPIPKSFLTADRWRPVF